MEQKFLSPEFGPENRPAEKKIEADVKLIKEESDGQRICIQENVFNGKFYFQYDPVQDKVVEVSNEGTDFSYPISERLREKAQWLAEKILLSKGASEKRKQKDLKLKDVKKEGE